MLSGVGCDIISKSAFLCDLHSTGPINLLHNRTLSFSTFRDLIQGARCDLAETRDYYKIQQVRDSFQSFNTLIFVC